MKKIKLDGILIYLNQGNTLTVRTVVWQKSCSIAIMDKDYLSQASFIYTAFPSFLVSRSNNSLTFIKSPSFL